MFKRTIEDFVCERCGFAVSGNGFTNHCPKCLYSKHVDIEPGDRESVCQGLMEPIGFLPNREGGDIVHKCVKCDFIKKNKVAIDDNKDLIIELSAKPIADVK